MGQFYQHQKVIPVMHDLYLKVTPFQHAITVRHFAFDVNCTLVSGNILKKDAVQLTHFETALPNSVVFRKCLTCAGHPR